MTQVYTGGKCLPEIKMSMLCAKTLEGSDTMTPHTGLKMCYFQVD